jgi:hypothetical protein
VFEDEGAGLGAGDPHRLLEEDLEQVIDIEALGQRRAHLLERLGLGDPRHR